MYLQIISLSPSLIFNILTQQGLVLLTWILRLFIISRYLCKAIDIPVMFLIVSKQHYILLNSIAL